MAHVGEKLGLQRVELLQLLIRAGKVESPAELAKSHLGGKLRAEDHHNDRGEEKEVVVQEYVESCSILCKERIGTMIHRVENRANRPRSFARRAG